MYIAVRAAANVSGEVITYNQGFRALKADKEHNYVTWKESYNLLVPYLKQFLELNEGSEVHYYLNDGKIEGLFLCPNFMNDSLRFVRPIMSLDAAHLKSFSKGQLYLAMVKTSLDELFTVAIDIERAMKDMMVGISFCSIWRMHVQWWHKIIQNQLIESIIILLLFLTEIKVLSKPLKRFFHPIIQHNVASTSNAMLPPNFITVCWVTKYTISQEHFHPTRE
jgi:hypothetical protein